VVSPAGSGLVELLSQLLPAWGIDYERFDPNNAQHVLTPDLLITDCPDCLIGVRPSTSIPILLVTAYGNFMASEQVSALAPLQQQARPLGRLSLHQTLARTLYTGSEQDHAHLRRELPRAHRARILLVEDNPVNQLVAKGMLGKLGCEVVISSHGGEALEALARDAFDLVLMDCNMPVMDGYEATRLIRQNSEWLNLPIIALTANAMPEERERCKTAGMSDYLAKPFHREELGSLLDQWIPAALAD
jgi:CheY-like chemotaxis protein